jgi:hypothetical protein
MTTILGGTSNPMYSVVRASIISALLLKTAAQNDGKGAVYRSKEEQAEALEKMFSQWKSASIWSQASYQVSMLFLQFLYFC